MGPSLSPAVARPSPAGLLGRRLNSRRAPAAPSSRRMVTAPRAAALPAEYQGLGQTQIEFMERSRVAKGLPPLMGAAVAPSGTNTNGAPPPAAETVAPEATQFIHAPMSHFAINQLTPKGPRKNVDWGAPEDFSRALLKGTMSVGSWACTEGGWDSPSRRPTTEAFYVLTGQGCVTDPDGTKHPFGPGDLVVLPKHWYGRWDIPQRIHKVFLTYDHPDVPGAAPTPVVVPLAQLQASAGGGTVRKDALHGAPAQAGESMYDVGPTSVGYWKCSPGSWKSTKRESEVFFVLEGVFFLTNADGSARRCGPGDTVVLPKGWSGHWDIVETVKKVWFIIKD